MHTLTLKAEWNKIKNRRLGPYFSMSPAQQAGYLLTKFSQAEAIAYVARFVKDRGETETGGFWWDTYNLLIDAK